MVAERDKYKKEFYALINTYPILKKQYHKDEIIYDDLFEPEYDYNIVYGEVHSDGTGFSPELTKVVEEFDHKITELNKSLKYHDTDIVWGMGKDYEVYAYQLYSKTNYAYNGHYRDPFIVGVDKLDDEPLKEDATILDVTISEPLLESVIQEDSQDGKTSTFTMVYSQPTIDSPPIDPSHVLDVTGSKAEATASGGDAMLEAAYEITMSIINESVEDYQAIVDNQQAKLDDLRTQLKTANHDQFMQLTKMVQKVERCIARNRRKIVVYQNHHHHQTNKQLFSDE